MKKGFILISILFLLNLTFVGQNSIAQNTLGQSVVENQFLPNEMDFSTAIKYSLEHNNNIRAMRKGLSASERDIGIARSTMLPKLVFNENFTATNNPTDALSYRLNQARATANDLSVATLNHPASVTNFLTSGVLEQRILDKKSMVGIKIAKKEYSANGYFYLRKQEDLVNQVAQAYLNVSTNQDYIKIAEEAIVEAKEHLEIAQARLKTKTGFPSDVLRAKTAVEEREEKLISAQRNLKVSKRSLGLLLGLESPVDVTNSIPKIELQDINYYESYSVYRNDIKATELRVENTKNGIKSAQAEWYPTFTAFGTYGFYNNNFPFGGQGNNYTTGAFFRWEILDGNKRKYEILKAKDKEAEAKEYLEGLRKEVNFKVYEVYSNIEEHQKRLELAKLVLKQSEEDTLLVQKRWKNSELPFVSLIDAQDNLDNARASVVKNKFDLVEDLINLAYESGIIYQELALK